MKDKKAALTEELFTQVSDGSQLTALITFAYLPYA